MVSKDEICSESMKTVEFKLDLNQQQQAIIDEWLDVMTWVWNNGLALLKWREYWLKLNSCKFYPKLKPKDEDIEIPAEIIQSWGFVEIGLAPLRYHLTEVGKSKIWGLASDRTTPHKININEYPSFKTQEYTKEVIKTEKIGKEVIEKEVIYSALEKLTEGQFLEQRMTKKGICYYLHSPEYRHHKPHWRNEPPIKSYSEFDIRGYFTQKNIKDAPAIPEQIKKRFNQVYSKFVAGECKTLFDSWNAYKSGKRREPRFKNRRYEQVKTLIDNNAAVREKLTEEDKERQRYEKAEAKVRGEKYKPSKAELTGSTLSIRGDTVKIPNLGYVRAKGLSKRWSNRHAVNYKITKEPSGYYLQLTGYFLPSKISLTCEEGNLKAIGIDAGVACLFADDAGRTVKRRTTENREDKRIIRLQRQLARRKDGSNNWRKTQHKIAIIHEKSRRRSIASDHKLTTKLVREYDGIACEDLNLQNMTAAPKSRLSMDGTTYAKVRRRQKAGLNKSLLRHSHGRRMAMIKSKVDAINDYHRTTVREFAKVSPYHSSQECRNCGYTDAKNRKTQAEFTCLSCGHSNHADVNAFTKHPVAWSTSLRKKLPLLGVGS